ncbi:rCG64236, partial [Rattus norvegicus]
MLPPHQLLEICTHTFVVNKHHEYLLATNHTYLACSSGLTTYVIISEFLQQRDYCVLVQLLPRLSIHEPQDILDFWDRNPGAPHRKKREPISAITLTVLLGLGTTGTGTGIVSLVTSQQNQQRYHLLSAAIDQDLAELREGLANLKDSVASLSEVILQNRRGLDFLCLQQGGLCVGLKEECCVYVDKTGLWAV